MVPYHSLQSQAPSELCGNEKGLTVKISKEFPLGRLSSAPGSRLRLSPPVLSVQHVLRRGTL